MLVREEDPIHKSGPEPWILLALSAPVNQSLRILAEQDRLEDPLARSLPPFIPLFLLKEAPPHKVLDRIRILGFPEAAYRGLARGKFQGLHYRSAEYLAREAWPINLETSLGPLVHKEPAGFPLPLLRKEDGQTLLSLILALGRQASDWVPDSLPLRILRPTLDLYTLGFDLEDGFFGASWARHYSERMTLFKPAEMP